MFGWLRRRRPLPCGCSHSHPTAPLPHIDPWFPEIGDIVTCLARHAHGAGEVVEVEYDESGLPWRCKVVGPEWLISAGLPTRILEKVEPPTTTAP